MNKRGGFYGFLTGTTPVLVCRAIGKVPLSWARACGRAWGLAAYYLVPRVRRVALANLDLVYGDALTRAEKRRIAKDAAKNVGIVAAEFPRTHWFATGRANELVEVRGMEHLEPNKGALIIGAHFGNWEWMAPAVASQGRRIVEVVRPLDNPVLNAFVDATRRSGGTDTLPKENGGPEILKRLREGWLVGVLIDQSPRSSAVPVRFMGKDCWCTVAPVMAAFRAKAAVHLATMTRQPNGRYRFEVSPALTLDRAADLHEDIVRNSQRCQDALEPVVRREPGQWLWLHRRWKRRERLEQEWTQRTRDDRGAR